MLGICGTTAFTSELVATKGVNDDELDTRLTAAGEIAGALLGADTGKVSGANEAEGTGGKADARFDGGKVDARFDGGKADGKADFLIILGAVRHQISRDLLRQMSNTYTPVTKSAMKQATVKAKLAQYV